MTSDLREKLEFARQRLRVSAAVDLITVQAKDLSSMKRWQIANLLFDLRASRRMQSTAGLVASRDEWDAAEARLEAEMAKRPPPKSRAKSNEAS